MRLFNNVSMRLVALSFLAAGLGFAQTITIVSGNGQITQTNFQTNETLKVVVKNAAGQPVQGATVTWTVSSGGGIVSSPSSTTNDKGEAEVFFLGPSLFGQQSSTQSVVTATTTPGGSVTFNVTTAGGDAFTGSFVSVNLNSPSLADFPLSGAAGATHPTPVQVRVVTTAGAQAGVGIPNVAVRVAAVEGSTASVSCSGGTVFTDTSGNATCNLVFGGVASPNVQSFTISVGGTYRTFNGTFRVTTGAFGAIRITSGNKQSGSPGQTLPGPLVAQTEDIAGNIVPNTTVVWESVTPTAVTLSNVVNTSDANGRVSATATLGGVSGTHQVRVRNTAGTISALFDVTINVTLTGMDKVSGDNQDAIISTDTQPLIVQVRSAQGAQPGVTVTWTVVSGTATVLSNTSTTDAQGRAQTIVRVGATPGPIVVQATAAGFTQTFNLTARLPGPGVTTSTLFSAAGGQRVDLSPSALVSAYGAGFATGIQGCVMGTNLVGPLPFQVASVTIQFGTLFAPIYAVCNLGTGQEYVVFQVPNELPVGSTNAVFKVGSGSTTLQNVPVVAASPGIFETVMADGRKRAVALRQDGGFVSLSNPAQRGERVRIFVTGLGAPANIGTGSVSVPGRPGAPPLPIVVGLNNEGVPNVISAEYSTSLPGIYEVTFEVPANMPSNANVPFAIAVVVNNQFVFGNPSALPIQ